MPRYTNQERKNHKNALRIIKEIIDEMSNENNWKSHGICGMVKTIGKAMYDYHTADAARAVIAGLTKDWPHYSGNVLYPVPSNIVGLPQEAASEVFGKKSNAPDAPFQMWSTRSEYGFARQSLLAYLHRELTILVNGHDEQESIRYSGDNDQSLGDILSAALNNQWNTGTMTETNSENTQMDTNINTSTLEGKIAVMQAVKNGADVEYRYKGDDSWTFCPHNAVDSLSWHWGSLEYRIHVKPKSKDTFDFAGLNQKWKYAARDKNGSLYLYDKEPILSTSSFHPSGNTLLVTELFDSYKIGDVDWKESLICRNEIDTMPSHITDLIRSGNFITAIKEHRLYFGTSLREAKDACHAWREANIPNWCSNMYR